MRILATFWLSGVIALCLLLTRLSPAQQKPATAPIVITHAAVINPGTSSVQANRTVVITGDHITSVSDAAKPLAIGFPVDATSSCRFSSPTVSRVFAIWAETLRFSWSGAERSRTAKSSAHA